MARKDPYDARNDDDEVDSLDEVPSRDQDAVASLHDTEAEAGDEEGLTDGFEIDEREARELGVQLDGEGDDEPRLD
jgi:hypothetical protein